MATAWLAVARPEAAALTDPPEGEVELAFRAHGMPDLPAAASTCSRFKPIYGSVTLTEGNDGELAYEVTDPRKRSTEYLEQEGPVAFITTTCRAKLDDEIETRILSLHSNGSDEQTRAVVKAIIEGADDTPPAPDLGPWHALDRWLGRSR